MGLVRSAMNYTCQRDTAQCCGVERSVAAEAGSKTLLAAALGYLRTEAATCTFAGAARNTCWNHNML